MSIQKCYGDFMSIAANSCASKLNMARQETVPEDSVNIYITEKWNKILSQTKIKFLQNILRKDSP